MPPLPNVPGVVRVDFKQVFAENLHILNRVFFRFSGVMDQAGIQAVADAASAEWNTHIAPQVVTDFNLVGTEATDLTSNTSPRAFNTTVHAGTAGGTALPAEVCFVTNFHIARRYRGGKPKHFQSGVNAGALADEERWSSAATTGVSSAVGACMTGIVSTGFSGFTPAAHVNVHFFHGFTVVDRTPLRPHIVSTPLATPTTDDVLAYTGDSRPGSQRRRSMQGN